MWCDCQPHTHTLTITCTCCCYNVINRIQDLKIYSHADSQILSLSLYISLVLVVMMNSTMRAGASPMPPAFLSFLRPSISFLPSVVLLASRTRWFSLVLSPRAHSACCLSCRLLPLSARMIRVLSCSFSDSLSSV